MLLRNFVGIVSRFFWGGGVVVSIVKKTTLDEQLACYFCAYLIKIIKI